MLRDRGIIKWQGMMIPEHVSMLREARKQDNRKKRPMLDEQKLEEMNLKISEAMEWNKPLKFILYKESIGDFEHIVGKVHYLDVNNKRILVVDEKEYVYRIPFREIVDVINE